MNNEIKVVVFDLGNVLIPFDYQILINRLNHIDKGLGNKFVNRYRKNYEVHRMFESGKLTENEFMNIMRDWTDNKVRDEEFKKTFSEIFSVNNKMVLLLQKLKPHFRLMLLSNTNSIHKKYGWEKYSFINHFEKLFLSHEIGAVKPEEKIYLSVQNYTKEKPEAHLFIDDVEEYVLGAKKLGWNAIHFISQEQAINDINKLLFSDIKKK